MNVNRLVVTIEATHQSLQQRLAEATRRIARRSLPRERYARTDAFLSATSRHLGAVDEVILKAARQGLPDGPDRVRDYLHQARLLEQAMTQLKARLYGEVHAAHRPWDEVWDDVRRELTRHNELERALVEDLAATLGKDESDALASDLFHAEVKAPTRAHPHLPHTGLMGLVARRAWALADRFWDTAEGRVVPDPVRPHPHEHAHDSLMAQYVMGEPRFDATAPLLTHRRHRH